MGGKRKNHELPALDWIEQYSHFFSPEPNTGCWLWHGHVSSSNYAVITVNTFSVFVHKVLYEKLFGPVSELDLDHLCRVTCCINPYHLEPVKHSVNISRSPKFLKDSDVVRIRELRSQGLTCQEIAKQFNVHEVTVSRYANGKRRNWL